MTDSDADGDGMVDQQPPDPLVTPEARGRSLRRAASLTAGMGIAFSVLFVVSYLLTTSVPGPTATDEEIFEYYASDARTLPVAVGLYLMPFAGIAFLWFIVALRMWAAASVRRQSVLQSNLQLVSGVVFVALFFVGAAASSVLAVSVQYADGPIDPVVARQFPIFGGSLILFFAMRMAAMFTFTTSAIGRTARILPRWFAISGYVVGAFLLLSTAFEPLLVLVFPAWVFGLCVILLRTARSIPREVRLPPAAGIGLMDPLGPYRDRERHG